MIRQIRTKRPGLPLLSLVVVLLLSATMGAAQAAPAAPAARSTPQFSTAVAFDVSPALRDLASGAAPQALQRQPADEPLEIRPDRGPIVQDQGFSGDGAIQDAGALRAPSAIPAPLANFEGLSNEDNLTVYGFRVNPPDPDGDVGPNHYVEMINLVLAVYDKQGNRLSGPTPIGAVWEGFAVEDCTDPSGDPIVLYDQLEDRWLLSQFTTRGLDDPSLPFYNCVAISVTGDPTGPYYRYAFTSGLFFPDYPKYGVWTNSYLLTSRDFGPTTEYGISVYALEKNKMLAGNPNARAVKFFLDSATVPIYLMGDGLLPPDMDGERRPIDRAPAPFVGTQDDDHPYGAPFDALNIFELWVQWQANPVASFALVAQLPVAEFDSIFPCGPTSRDCIPQPGVTDPNRYLDVLSYRQRPTWRLAYRNFGRYEAMVTNQSVEARPGIAGVRWYEIRPRRQAVLSVPAGHLRPGRRRPSLDGQHRDGPAGQHQPGLQRVEWGRRLSRHPLHRPAQKRPTGPDDPG